MSSKEEDGDKIFMLFQGVWLPMNIHKEQAREHKYGNWKDIMFKHGGIKLKNHN